ncbi:hypothetical protein [Glutamicibacter sp. NPDC087344]|uniref:hypothetical protein n=1 Tax=Glutamicibacter sp. NPDC087344 TaxID=3363994 RepID=UPI0038166FD7
MNQYEARAKALELILANMNGGLKWETIIKQADKFAQFILSGEVPEPGEVEKQ